MSNQSNRNRVGNFSLGRACRTPAVLAALVAWSLPGAVLAQSAAAPSSYSGSFYAFAGGAAFFPQKSGQLQGESAGLAFMAGGGYRAAPSLSVEANVLFAAREIDTPPGSWQPAAGTFVPGTLDSSIGLAGVAATAKYTFQVDRLEPYFGGGVGAYRSAFVATSEAPGCTQNCSDTGPRVTRRSNDLGIHVLAGTDFHFTPKDMMMAELRYLRLRADFGDIVSGKINAGGVFFSLGYRRAF